MNKLNVIYVYVFPSRVEVSESPKKFYENKSYITSWVGHWENFLTHNDFKNQEVIRAACEAILTLLSDDDCSVVSIPF